MTNYKKKAKDTWKVLKSPNTRKKLKKGLRKADRFFRQMNQEFEETFEVR